MSVVVLHPQNLVKSQELGQECGAEIQPLMEPEEFSRAGFPWPERAAN